MACTLPAMRTDTSHDLRHAWTALTRDLGLPPGRAGRILDDLVARHAAPTRAYHTLRHVRQVLADVDALLAAGEPAHDPAAIRLAAWFHDAVYDATATGNERASADLAEEALRLLGLEPARRADVAALVLTTADHLPVTDDARILVDADLAVLGATPAAYARYRQAIRREYRMVPEERWCRGRAEVLQRFLARPRIYSTPSMQARVERAARRNLAAELETLRSATRTSAEGDG